MQKKSSQKLFKVIVVMQNGLHRSVDVKATTQQVAESRALKRTFGAVSIYKGKE